MSTFYRPKGAPPYVQLMIDAEELVRRWRAECDDKPEQVLSLPKWVRLHYEVVKPGVEG